MIGSVFFSFVHFLGVSRSHQKVVAFVRAVQLVAMYLLYCFDTLNSMMSLSSRLQGDARALLVYLFAPVFEWLI
jgi:hypothetical protein